MAGATQTMFLSFDACVQGLVQEFARAGDLPNFARLYDVEEFNRVDMNVLAHRREVANARFESRSDEFGTDWLDEQHLAVRAAHEHPSRS